MSSTPPGGSSSNRGVGGLPPPPRMLGARRNVASNSPRNSKETQQQQQQQQPHSVDTTLPTLDSAPTSATNLEGLATIAAQAATDQFRAAVDVLSGYDYSSYMPSVAMTSSAPTSANNTVPEQQQQQQSSDRRVASTSSVTPIKSSPASFPLPPPPVRSSGGHSTLPPPPPPATTSQRPSPSAASGSTTYFQPTLAPVPTSQHVPTTEGSPKQVSSTDTIAPPFLPKNRFRSKQLRVTAARQESITILIVATENAHRLAWKNSLRLSDLLQGMTVNMEVPKAPFRSVNRTMMAEQLSVQFLEDESFLPIDDGLAAVQLQQAAALQDTDGNLQAELELLEDQVDNLLSDDNNNTNSDGLSSLPSADHHEQVAKDAFKLTSSLTIPWLVRYRQALDDGTDCLSHEFFHCPALVLCICTTDDGDVVETLRALQLPHYLPVQFRNGHFDSDAVRRDVLVLHDNVEGPKDLDEGLLRNRLLPAFGATSFILRINSLAPETAAVLATEEESDPWGGNGSLGTCLTVADRARVRKYLGQHLIATSLLPSLERRIADLNAIVSDRKKGVKNVLKSFWGRSSSAPTTSKDEETTVNPDMPYRYDSVESQTRLLADTLFQMRDYDAAYSMYRLIRDDYKQDKYWIHYASIQEMMAISLCMSDPYGRAREIFSSIESALLSYNRAAESASLTPQWGEKPGRASVAPIPTRLATRLCLVLLSTRNVCSGRHLEVADLLASASSHETSLGAAVLLEQSSAHYFHAEMFRKYAFHMLMSGHMFRSSEQEHHAFRCFTSALCIYRDGRWEELHNHLRSALAAQLFSMGRMAIALQLYGKLLGSTDGGKVSMKSQQKFVNNLIEICNDHHKKALVGADRMAAPSNISGAERDRVRKERLDRIVQVVRYTKTASRVLEIPNMDLPLIDDSSVVVIAEEAAHNRQENAPSFGEAQSGSEEIWEDLVLSATAELKAAFSKVKMEDKIIVNKTLAMIDDFDIRNVIALIDKEKVNKSMMERNKKSGRFTDKAPVRAIKEPITVEFSVGNPLSLPIDLCDLQLVAKMKEDFTDRICTNEDAVSIRPLASANEKEIWTFQSSEVEFKIPDFCRVSTDNVDVDRMSWKSAEDVEPFFVVSKTNVTVNPESKKVVSASICPLALGYLEIVGVRCRLFDDVWVYHPFDIKGPLLQNTRSNRANRVRGESFLLKSKVERGMPCLAVDLIRDGPGNAEVDGPVLSSQVGKWLLRMSNIGTATASEVTLKTNIPWICFDEDSDELDNEKRATSMCIGPTGTLMMVPLDGDVLQTNGQIQPGETIDLPVEIRSTGTGKQDFYILFRYELFDEASSQSSRPRWLKKMFSVPIFPSLELRADVNPSFSDSNEHILSLEITNCRTDRPASLEITPSEVSVASRHYRLEALPGQLDETISLGWQERLAYHYKLIRKDAGGEEHLVSRSSFVPKKVACYSSNSSLKFMSLERAHENFQECLKVHQMALARAAARGEHNRHPRSIASIRRANTTESSIAGIAGGDEDTHATSLARLCPLDSTPQSIHLLCSWSAQNGSIIGSHHIRDLAVRPRASNKVCPITITASHPSKVNANQSNGLASILLEITLRNILVDDSVNFEFEMASPDNFDFTGPEVFRSSLAAGEELSLPFRASFPSSGVYNLQKVRLTVGKEERMSYEFPSQWMVTVLGT